MSIKNFDISYGYGGEASTATVSYVEKNKECQNVEIHQTLGAYGSGINTGNREIDEALDGFIINEIKTSKDGGFKTITYNLIDSRAKKLDGVAVLVRGITAPSVVDELKYFGKIFNSSELGINIGEEGKSGIKIHADGKIAVIGRTFSVVSASFEDETGSVFYSGGEEVARTPEGGFSSDLIDALNDNFRNAELRFGYYLSDLEDLISNLKYTVDGFPKEENFIIIDFGGSLKEVISSVAGMFGLYWIVRGNKITFYNQGDVVSFAIPDFNAYTDPNILSSSYSKDILGKSTVGVLAGSTAPVEAKSSTFGERTFNIHFYRAEIEDYYGDVYKWIANFLSFFLLSKNTSFFNKFVYQLMVKEYGKGGPDILTDTAFFKSEKYYGDYLKSNQPTTLQEIEGDVKTINKVKEQHKYLNTYTDLYSLQRKGDGNSFIKEPSSTPLMSIVQSLCQSVFHLYISKPVSKYFGENYSVSASGNFSVAGPYIGTTPIKDIPELSSILTVYEEIHKADQKDDAISQAFLNLRLVDLAEKIKIVKRENKGIQRGAYTVIDIDNAYYFIGTYPFINGDKVKKEVEECRDALIAATEDGSGENYNHGSNSQNYFCSNVLDVEATRKMFSTSAALYNKSLLNTKQAVHLAANKIKKETIDSDVDLSIYAHEYKSFETRYAGQEFSSVEILKLEGTNSEIKYLNSQFNRLASLSFFSEASSVTYSGLVIPEESPLITSLSITFSGGSIETSISYSNKEFLAESESVVMAGYSTSSSSDFRRKLNTRQKTFLGVR